MIVIRLKKDPKQIKAYGYTKPGGLGPFDEELFEEVELDELPKDYKQYEELPLAMGADIAKYAQLSFEGANFILRAALLALFEDFPVSKASLPKLVNGNKEIFEALQSTAAGDFININLKGVLESPTCNPLSKSDFLTLVELIDNLPAPFEQLKTKYLALANDYKDKVRFINA